MGKRGIALLAGLATMTVAAGCGDDMKKDTSTTGASSSGTTMMASDKGATETGAATLRAGLTKERYYFVMTDRFANGDPSNDR